MSRIGRAPIAIPEGVKVEINDSNITVTGKLGTLTRTVVSQIAISVEDNSVICKRSSDSKPERALHGLTRSLINNMVIGVTKGYEKSLIINGVGYRAAIAGKKLTLNIGYSHPVEIEAPEGITFVQAAPLEIVVKGIDKQLVGQVAATIKAAKKIEPYHGYGIRYKEEPVILKEGKTAGK